MKCNHTGLCTYESATVYVPAVRGFRVDSDGSSQMPGQMRCDECGEVVGLGESWDTPVEVQIEIRAAEIAVGLAEGGCVVSPVEQSGFNDEPMRLRNGHPLWLDVPSFHSGRLAHAIATHDDEGGE